MKDPVIDGERNRKVKERDFEKINNSYVNSSNFFINTRQGRF